MKLRVVLAALMTVAAFSLAGPGVEQAEAQAGRAQASDWNRFYYYPYVYYPHTYQRPQTYNHLYHKYGQASRIPVYNKHWYNFYPTSKPYHSGHHFILDAL